MNKAVLVLINYSRRHRRQCVAYYKRLWLGRRKYYQLLSSASGRNGDDNEIGGARKKPLRVMPRCGSSALVVDKWQRGLRNAIASRSAACREPWWREFGVAEKLDELLAPKRASKSK